MRLCLSCARVMCDVLPPAGDHQELRCRRMGGGGPSYLAATPTPSKPWRGHAMQYGTCFELIFEQILIRNGRLYCHMSHAVEITLLALDLSIKFLLIISYCIIYFIMTTFHIFTQIQWDTWNMDVTILQTLNIY